MAKRESRRGGVRIYVLTVDARTNAVLRTEEEDPDTGRRTPARLGFPQAPAPTPPAPAGFPAGFTPSVVIWVSGALGAAAAASGSRAGQVDPLPPDFPLPPEPPPIIDPVPPDWPHPEPPVIDPLPPIEPPPDPMPPPIEPDPDPAPPDGPIDLRARKARRGR